MSETDPLFHHHAPQAWPNPVPTAQPAGLVEACGVYIPLQGVDAAAPLQGGYGFLDWTDGGATPHPGCDLNTPGGCHTDAGALVVAPVAGIVRFVHFWDQVSSGEGTHAWLELDGREQAWTGGTTWFHVDHLATLYCGVGERLVAGDPIGTCGRTGNWQCEHAHVEFARARPSSFWQWPYGWSPAAVENAYYNPSSWISRTVAEAALIAQQAGQGGVDVSILSGAQQAAVQAVVWDDLWDPAAADFAIPASWREEWKAGRWRGEPQGPEQPIPAADGKPAGSWQLFTHGAACWLPNEPVSWSG